MTASPDSVLLKLVRAEEHFEAIVEVLDRVSVGQCELIPEENQQMGVLRVHLTKPPQQLPLLIADFLYGVRSALDHLVWQLALANSPNTPSGKTAFPICSSPENFKKAKERHRLDGVSVSALTIIESFQPYPGRDQTLLTLSELHERDKHRTLNLVTAVASDTVIDWTSGDTSLLKMFIGGEEIRDGAIFGEVGIPLDDPALLEFLGNESLASFRQRYLKMKVQGQAAIFVAFGGRRPRTFQSRNRAAKDSHAREGHRCSRFRAIF
jgi:hypothetical protein